MKTTTNPYRIGGWSLTDLRSLATRNGVAWTATLTRHGSAVATIDESDPASCGSPGLAWLPAATDEDRADWLRLARLTCPDAARYGDDCAALECAERLADAA